MKKFKILFLLIFFNFLLVTSLSAQMEWICATDSAGWSARNQHTSVVFDNKLWVMGGTNDVSNFNDVWYSNDGMNWTQITASAQWSPRPGHSSVVFDDKMWVIGGGDSISAFNDVWYSNDGVNWTQAIASAQWSPRFGHSSVVFDNKIWVIGGRALNNYFHDVWYSTDGINWTQANASAPWATRSGHTSVIFDNKLWVIGGSYIEDSWWITLGDVWYSTDGVDWYEIAISFPWLPRFDHTSVLYDNKIWLMGGSVFHAFYNDVWYSTDCANWFQANDSAPWVPRFGHTSVVFNNKMWVLGGYDGNSKNDVWYSQGLGIEESGMLVAACLTPEIYPNPARSFLAVCLPYSADRQTLKIFDVSGKLIKVDEVTGAQEHKQEMRISLEGITPGIYFLQLGKDVKKFLVVK